MCDQEIKKSTNNLNVEIVHTGQKHFDREAKLTRN